MTVKVTLPSGDVDDYARYGDNYFENANGSLDVVRTGAKEPHCYAAGEWSSVDGDERKHKKRWFSL